MLVVVGAIARPDGSNRKVGGATEPPTLSSNTKAVAAETGLPQSQREFLGVVAEYKERFRSAANELQQSTLRDQRRTAVVKVLGSQLIAENWIGTLRNLETNTEGKAIVSVRLASGVDLLTWNNALSDTMHQTMIDKGTPVYAALMNMTVGDPVMVSGKFVPSDQDGALETSMTIDGSMNAPEFLFRFNQISKQ